MAGRQSFRRKQPSSSLQQPSSSLQQPSSSLQQPSSSLQQPKYPSFSNDPLLPYNNNVALNLNLLTIAMNQKDCESCIENLDKVKDHGNNLVSIFNEELEKAKSMNSVDDLKAVINGLYQSVQYYAPMIIGCASQSKVIFEELLNIIKTLNMAKVNLEGEIGQLKKTVTDLQNDLIKYKEKAEDQAIEINHLKEEVAKLNDQLKITEEYKAKLLIRQVINVVPTKMYWRIFSDKKKNKKTFWLSEIDCHLNKFPDTTEFDKQVKSKKVALFEKYIKELGGDLEEMERFMKKFKEDIWGNQVAHPPITDKNKILEAVDILTKSEDIDVDDVAKISILANVWENLDLNA